MDGWTHRSYLFVAIVTTRCILLELSSQPALKGAHFIAKRLQLRKCSHSGVLPPTECINTLIGR